MPRFRLVVRITNKRVIAQIASSTLTGDKILESADSTDLSKYGMTAGLKNYSAAYLTGFLLGKRILQKQGLDKFYTGNKVNDGKAYDVMNDYNALDAKGQENLRKPFKA